MKAKDKYQGMQTEIFQKAREEYEVGKKINLEAKEKLEQDLIKTENELMVSEVVSTRFSP